jgi:hypothetical protein
MQVRLIVGACAVVSLLIGLVLLATLFGGINLTEYATQLAVGLTLLIFGIIYWTFRPKIDYWVDLKTGVKRSLIPAKIMNDGKNLEQPKSMEVDLNVDPVQHYDTRDALPFADMLSIAKSTVEMSAVSFTILTLQHYDHVRSGIARGLKFTFLILDPNSQYVQKQTELYHAADDLKNQIEKAVRHLCNLQKEYPENVIIRTYDSLARYSIVILDRANAENAWARIERRPIGSDSNSRSSDAAHRKYDLGFNESKDDYDRIFTKSKIYECPATS